jgi:small-conductance mechanosensitive channel
VNEALANLDVAQLLDAARLMIFVRAFLALAIGYLIARAASRGLVAAVGRRFGADASRLAGRLAFYFVIGLASISALNELGFDLGVVLGAAGILSVAVGFASQTAASNIISGFFLVAERPFKIGDQLVVDGNLGEVMSIDALSVKLRMFDNVLMRVPNEHLIKSIVMNRTHFPIRRIDLQIGVAYKESMEQVREILFHVADRNPLALEEPAPVFIYRGYGDSALTFQFSIWTARENFLALRNSIQEQIKQALDEAGIEIPFPHRTLYTGSVTEPFPIRLVRDEPEAPHGP